MTGVWLKEVPAGAARQLPARIRGHYAYGCCRFLVLVAGPKACAQSVLATAPGIMFPGSSLLQKLVGESRLFALGGE